MEQVIKAIQLIPQEVKSEMVNQGRIMNSDGNTKPLDVHVVGIAQITQSLEELLKTVRDRESQEARPQTVQVAGIEKLTQPLEELLKAVRDRESQEARQQTVHVAGMEQFIGTLEQLLKTAQSRETHEEGPDKGMKEIFKWVRQNWNDWKWIKKNHNPISAVVNSILVFLTVVIVLLTGILAGTAWFQADAALSEAEANRKMVDLMWREHYAKIQVELIMTTSFLGPPKEIVSIEKKQGYFFSSEDWKKYSGDAKFKMIVQNTGSKRVDAKLMIKYRCYAYGNSKERLYNMDSTSFTIPFKAVPGYDETLDITPEIMSVMASLAKNYGGSFPDKLTIEIGMDETIQVIEGGAPPDSIKAKPRYYFER